MKKFSKLDHLVINSKDESTFFQLGNGGEIKYTFLNNSYEPIETLTLFDDNVLKYSIDIDKNNRIHLISLMKSGDLNYSIYSQNNWSNSIIARFDFRSNIYSDIDILVEEDSINIIYAYANLINSKLWTIQHVVGNNQNWNQYNITKFVSDRISTPFIVDKDSFGTIHLLYRSMEGDNFQIYHLFYNSFTQKWNPVPQRLATSNTSIVSPYIFVDSKDNIHGLWLEEIDKNYIIKYSKLTSKGDEKYIWNQTKIPYIKNCNNTPIIFEEKGVLKIIYSKINSIGYIYSLDSGNTWFDGDIYNVEHSKIGLMKVYNPMSHLKSIRINNIYYSINGQLDFYFSDSFNSLNVSPKESSTDIVETLDEPQVKNQDLEEMQIKIEQLLNFQKQIIDLLNSTIDSQNKIDENIEFILETMKTRKASIFHRLFNSFK